MYGLTSVPYSNRTTLDSNQFERDARLSLPYSLRCERYAPRSRLYSHESERDSDALRRDSGRIERYSRQFLVYGEQFVRYATPFSRAGLRLPRLRLDLCGDVRGYSMASFLVSGTAAS